jgi:hypothetical protein
MTEDITLTMFSMWVMEGHVPSSQPNKYTATAQHAEAP